MHNYVRMLILGIAILFLSLPAFCAHVSAQTGINISEVTLNGTVFDLGDRGNVTISINSVGVPAYIDSITIYFYSSKTDGSYSSWSTGSNYYPPRSLPVFTTLIEYTFWTPTDAEILSSPIHYVVSISGTQSGQNLSYTTPFSQATNSGNNVCWLSNPIHQPYLSVVGDYNSLYSNYSSLSSNYSMLNSNYGSLSLNYSTLSSNYSSLQNSYDSLSDEHDYLATEVNAVRSQVSSLQAMVYGLAALTISLLATTIYFARKIRMKS